MEARLLFCELAYGRRSIGRDRIADDGAGACLVESGRSKEVVRVHVLRRSPCCGLRARYRHDRDSADGDFAPREARRDERKRPAKEGEYARRGAHVDGIRTARHCRRQPRTPCRHVSIDST